MATMFIIKMENRVTLHSFMKLFRGAILQLDSVSMNTVMLAVKQAVKPNTLFFNSLALEPLGLVDGLFQRGNQYSMFEDDILAAVPHSLANSKDEGNRPYGLL